MRIGRSLDHSDHRASQLNLDSDMWKYKTKLMEAWLPRKQLKLHVGTDTQLALLRMANSIPGVMDVMDSQATMTSTTNISLRKQNYHLKRLKLAVELTLLLFQTIRASFWHLETIDTANWEFVDLITLYFPILKEQQHS